MGHKYAIFKHDDKVRIRETAKNENIRGEPATFVKYSDGDVKIDGKIYHVVTNSMDEIDKAVSNLKSGDKVKINNGARKKEIRGRKAEFVEYTKVCVAIDGVDYYLSPNSVENV